MSRVNTTYDAIADGREQEITVIGTMEVREELANEMMNAINSVYGLYNIGMHYNSDTNMVKIEVDMTTANLNCLTLLLKGDK